MATLFDGREQDRRRRVARELPADDVVGVLLRQHADIADRLEQLENSAGDQRRDSFAVLGSLLPAHESAMRELASKGALGDSAGTQRDDVNQVMPLLDTMGSLPVDSAAFSDLSEQLIDAASTMLASEQKDLEVLARLPREHRLLLGARVRARGARRADATRSEELPG